MPFRNRLLTTDLWEVAIVIGPTLVAAAVFLLGCWRLVDLTATEAFTQAEERIFWVVLCAAGGWHIISAGIRRSFRPQQSRRRMLLAIAGSYGGLIVAFAGIYYVLNALSDRAQTFAVARQYSEWLKRSKPPEAPATIEIRAFRGMESLWAGADAYFRNARSDSPTPADYLVAFERASAQGLAAINPIFKPELRGAALLDCMHFSIATMTTTGFGDIVPTRWYSKLAADMQIIAGMSMLIFALGMLFGNWWWREPLEDQRESLRFGTIDFRDSFWHDRLVKLRPRAAIEAQRQEAAAPGCPWCGSPYTVAFHTFPAPSKGQDFDPSDNRILFIFILSIASYLVYSFAIPHYFAALSPVGQRIAAVPAIAVVATMIQVPCSLFSASVRRRREARGKAEYEAAFDTYRHSWSCETCHNVFREDDRTAGGGPAM